MSIRKTKSFDDKRKGSQFGVINEQLISEAVAIDWGMLQHFQMIFNGKMANNILIFFQINYSMGEFSSVVSRSAATKVKIYFFSRKLGAESVSIF